jgi:ketosteroid isomerase-like protein
MKQRQLASWMLSAAILIPVPAAAQGSQDAAVETITAFHDALARGDSTAALAFLAPDVLIYESGGAEQSRAEYRSHHLVADMEFASNTSREVVTQKTNDSGDIAWVTSTSATRGTFRDREINMLGTETMVLRRTSEGWQIVHIHWSSRRQQSE